MIGGEQSLDLTGQRVLVGEDEYFIAFDMKTMLERWGARVLGPVGTSDAALALLAAEPPPSLAILDVNLGSDGDVYHVAEALRARAVPMVFATGYDHSHIRRDFKDVPHAAKPFEARSFGRALAAHP